jgi:hypothetical protein
MATNEELLEQLMYRVAKVSTFDGKRTLATDRDPVLLEVFTRLGWSDPYIITPAVTSLVPFTAVVGAASFTLHVMGSRFRPGTIVLWNGIQQVTTYVSPTEVTTLVDLVTTSIPPGPPSLNIPVAVRSLTGVDSNTVLFVVTASLAKIEALPAEAV